MIFPLKGGICGNYVRMVRGKVVKKPISYCYTPYFDNEGAIGAIEVWQILEDEVLGKLYPWQYVPAASMSSRIEVLNFQALANFSQDVITYHDVPFIYKLSARLLEEGNVHRLAQSDLPNLYMCFDIYALEAFGERNSRMGLNFLRKRGAKIMIEGIERAPVDVIAKYRPDAYLIDYRYFNESNKSMLSLFHMATKEFDPVFVVGNVVNKTNLQWFVDAGCTLFGGSAFSKPKKRLANVFAS